MWEVVPTNLFLIYAHDSPPESGIYVDLLVEISGEGSLNGSFRWSVRSSEPHKTRFSAKGMCSYDGVDGYELSYEVKPCDLPFRHNTSTTSWEDMADLITEGRISVTKDGEDAQHEFIGKITCLSHFQIKTLMMLRSVSEISLRIFGRYFTKFPRINTVREVSFPKKLFFLIHKIFKDVLLPFNYALRNTFNIRKN
jgi:hypothetical protein